MDVRIHGAVQELHVVDDRLDFAVVRLLHEEASRIQGHGVNIPALGTQAGCQLAY